MILINWQFLAGVSTDFKYLPDFMEKILDIVSRQHPRNEEEQEFRDYSV